MPIHSLHLLVGDVRIWTLLGELPFLIFVVALYLAGRRQGWPWRASLVAAAAFVAGLGAGTAFLPSVIGASFGGIVAWLLAARLLGLRRPPLAALALGLVALVAVGRWGCLLNGCCFGTITDLPWGIRYGEGSHAHFLHRALGLLGDGKTSLPVHPYPAYESLGLLLWLPFAFWLSRRLRSQGTLLAFSAAIDLGLRGFLDGERAMINVWWSVLGAWHGLNLFRWSLLASSAGLFLLGLLFERRARAASPSETRLQQSEQSHRLWLVYVGLWTLGWLSDSAQTDFVHRALLLALAACVPALAIPRELSIRLRARGWVGHAVAATLVLVLGIRLETGARADGTRYPAHGSSAARTWLYDIDHRRGVMIRIGSDRDADDELGRREDMLGLPRLAELSKRFASNELAPPVHFRPVSSPAPATESRSTTDAPPPERPPQAQFWLGAGIYGGHLAESKTQERKESSSSDNSCGGKTYTTTSTRERNAFGGWARLEREIPRDGQSVYWIGGRAGAVTESQREDVTTNDPYDRASSAGRSRSAQYLNLWGEYESPSLALGLGVLGLRAGDQGTWVLPGFHVRGGGPRFGFDVGFADRMSFLGELGGHVGFSAVIRRGDQIRYPNDVRMRLFFGAFLFPGCDLHHFDVAPGFGLEGFLGRRVAVGLDGAILWDRAFGGVHLRTALGD